MVEIYDLSDCPFSKRAGLYGGAAGAKDGIIFRHENWIIKYSGSTGGLRGNNLSKNHNE